MRYLVACSGGNDSLALIQFMQDVASGEYGVVYNDTGWARDDWASRMDKIKELCSSYSAPYYETSSEGMISLVKRKKGWPMPASSMQFCTHFLKEKPTLDLLQNIDPEGDLIIVTGRRREESRNRATLSVWQCSSAKYGGRDVYNPLASYSVDKRNLLIAKAGWDVLPHSSMECYPCVCSNKKDLAKIPKNDARIDLIEITEIDMGFTRNEKPRTMFRPYRVGGGVGIRQTIDWAHGKHGYKPIGTPSVYQHKGQSLTSGENDTAYELAVRADSRQCDGGLCGD